tara:strand:- start:875 stop:1426 length:552 start_codon:yes stop_codon:yes gene_type:complete
MNIKKIITVALVLISVLIAGIIVFEENSSAKSIKTLQTSSNSNNEKSSKLKAPDFTLTDTEGNKVSLSDYKGNIIIINFWATWCGPCKFEIPDLIDLYKKYNGDVVVLGISLDYDGPTVVPQFADQYGINYPVLYGDSKIVSTYGNVTGIPTTFIIDRDLNLYRRYVGYRPSTVFEEDIKDLI